MEQKDYLLREVEKIGAGGHHLFQSFELWKRLMKNLANPENLIKIVVQTNNKIKN